MALVTVTDSARDYLAELINKQDVEGMGVRIFVTQPGTKHAETCLAYCPPNEVVPTDEQLDLGKFPCTSIRRPSRSWKRPTWTTPRTRWVAN